MFHHCNHPIILPFWKPSTINALQRAIYSLQIANYLKILNHAASTRFSDDNKKNCQRALAARLQVISTMVGNPLFHITDHVDNDWSALMQQYFRESNASNAVSLKQSD